MLDVGHGHRARAPRALLEKGWRRRFLPPTIDGVKPAHSMSSLLGLLASVGACATAPRPTPQVLAAPANMHAPPPVPLAEPNEFAHMSAALLLEQALAALRDARGPFATAALHAALATGELNDAGRALAYWYIYVAEEMQECSSRSHDALSDFVAIAQNVLALQKHARVADSGGSDFVERFDLHGRLARGRALLNLAWADRHEQFGRSAEAPIPIQSEEELRYFVELTPACAHPLERKTSAVVPQASEVADDVGQVEFFCGGLPSKTTFFFEWRGKRSLETLLQSKAASAPRAPAAAQ
jgi:hypothetical protein